MRDIMRLYSPGCVFLIGTLLMAGCTSSRDRAIKRMIAERQSKDSAPRVGEPAPDLSLQTRDGARTVELAALRGKRPVILIFGSYT